jgi:hypothetical protein
MQIQVKRSLAWSLGLALSVWAGVGHAQTESMSREFKVPLKLSAFANGEAGRQQYAAQWAQWIQASQGVSVAPKLKLDKTRSVQFLDVRGSCDLRAAQFVLRARDDDKGRQRLTLKTRSSDAAWVRATDISAPGGAAKLEEDVNPGKSQLSRSVTVKLDKEDPLPTSIRTAARSLPALSRLGVQGNLERVSGLLIQEQVYAMPSWKLGGATIEAELSFWTTDSGELVFAEASFSYDVPAKDPDAVDKPARTLFESMVAPDLWVERGRATKTEWVYTHEAGFCR